MNCRETTERVSKSKAQQLLQGQNVNNPPVSGLGRGSLRYIKDELLNVGTSIPQPTTNATEQVHGHGLLRPKGDKSYAVGYRDLDLQQGTRKNLLQSTSSDLEEPISSPRPLRERIANQHPQFATVLRANEKS